MMVNPPHNFEEECLLGVNCVYKVGSLGYFIAVINGTKKQKEIKSLIIACITWGKVKSNFDILDEINMEVGIVGILAQACCTAPQV